MNTKNLKLISGLSLMCFGLYFARIDCFSFIANGEQSRFVFFLIELAVTVFGIVLFVESKD